MNIVVCVKQVPGTTRVDIDEETGVLKRDGVEAKMNPYDLYGVETAVRIAEEYGGKVTTVTMGPMQAESILRESYTMGAHQGILLSGKAFAGADVLATSYALSQAVTAAGAFDLVICGKQTTDGDTAQVGSEMAEYLGIPHVSNVTQIVSVSDKAIRLEADMGEILQTLDVDLPCLITVEKDIYVPRLPSYKRKLATENREIRVLSLADLADPDEMHYGLSGSPTKVERIFPPESNGEKTWIKGSGQEIAEILYGKLAERKFV